MAKKYTKNGTELVSAGAHIVDNGRYYYCVSEEWLTEHGYAPYTEVEDDGEDGIVDGQWVHYLGKPYVAPEPEPYVEPEPTEEEREQMRIEAERQQKQMRINELQQMLRDKDYIGIKIATGRATIEEYADEIAQMQEWADEINALNAELYPTIDNNETEE